MAQETVPIPEPKALPLLGNLWDIDSHFPLGSMVSLSKQYGEIVRLRFPSRTMVLVSTQALVNETCDEKRFRKSINATFAQIRNAVHDGLFTAREDEENWGIAHRILMPAFGPLSIRNMFDEMHEIASQLTLKWARYGPDHPIMVTEDFTRLTLDTIALCSMGFRFNSFYSPVLHRFIEAMADFLTESGERARRMPLPSVFYNTRDQKFQRDIDVLRTTAREVLEARKAAVQRGTSDRRDLLTAMLEGVDPKTRRHMTDESIMDNLITFLIAGHETTSGLLSFACYELIKHPDKYQRAQREVDQVVGKGAIRVEHLSRLPYLNAVLRETLRLNATIPLFTVEAREDTLLAGKYPVKKGETIANLLARSHLDPRVYGEDAESFVPERMLDDEFERRSKEFPSSWKPFGNGVRACIGRPFAWQEALLVMAMLLQNFNFALDDPNYVKTIKQTLTIKPKDMYMRAFLRDGLTPTTLERRLAGFSSDPEKAPSPGPSGGENNARQPVSSEKGTPLTVLYGSNSGTCEALAHRVASDAAVHGFRAVKVDCLDSAQGQLPKNVPVIVITASYEGLPPDNAGHFVAWLEGMEAESTSNSPLKDVSFAVFGCGNHDWVRTYHRIPKLVDQALENLGGTRVAPLGLGDVAQGDVFAVFEAWEDEVLWPALKQKFQTSAEAAAAGAKRTSGLTVTVTFPRTSTLRQDVKEATVVDARPLTKHQPSDIRGGTKKHLEIRLPEGMTYRTGDYLAVLPVNPDENVRRALRAFRLPRDAHLSISSDGPTSLPVNETIPAYDVMSSYVELSQPATRRNIAALAEAAGDEKHENELNRLAGEAYSEEVNSKRVSVLDLLERFPSINLPIGDFLSMLPPMRVRQYSISSSPLWNPKDVTLTVSVLSAPALSGSGHLHMGVASTYLDSLSPGDAISVAVRTPNSPFRLPVDAENTPMICVAAGTGLAPFRGFIQERASMLAAGRRLAPALLFFGCRDPDYDDLYRDEMDEWERLGAVTVRRAYSRRPEASEGCKHVQDRMWREREELLALWRRDARVYVCGSRGVAGAARDMAVRLRMELEKEKGQNADETAVREWIDSLRNVRYVMDVFD